MSSVQFDASRAWLEGRDFFPRFQVPAERPRLAGAELAPDEPLLVATRGEERLAFLVRHVAFHHVAQGVLGDEPFVLSF